MRKIIAVGGVPGTGKTTLFRKFMEGLEWETVEPIKLVTASYNKKHDLYILGKYEEGEVFAGTDKLGMSCQPNASEFVANTKSNILFEGDRLTNGKFYNFLIELPETEVDFLIIEAKQNTLVQRYADRGSNQSSTFLKGRDTKISNILNNFEFRDYTTLLNNENLEDQKIILEFLENKLK